MWIIRLFIPSFNYLSLNHLFIYFFNHLFVCLLVYLLVNMQRKAKQRPFAGKNVLSESSFQLSVDSNQELLLLFITSPFVYSRKLAPFLNQSDSKLNPIVSWLPAFFRASLLLWALIGCSSHFPFVWLAVAKISVLIFTTLNRKILHYNKLSYETQCFNFISA